MPQVIVLPLERGSYGPFIRLSFFPKSGRDVSGPYIVITPQT